MPSSSHVREAPQETVSTRKADVCSSAHVACTAAKGNSCALSWDDRRTVSAWGTALAEVPTSAPFLEQAKEEGTCLQEGTAVGSFALQGDRPDHLGGAEGRRLHPRRFCTGCFPTSAACNPARCLVLLLHRLFSHFLARSIPRTDPGSRGSLHESDVALFWARSCLIRLQAFEHEGS